MNSASSALWNVIDAVLTLSVHFVRVLVPFMTISEIISSRYTPKCAYCDKQQSKMHRLEIDPLVRTATCDTRACEMMAVDGLNNKFESMSESNRFKRKYQKIMRESGKAREQWIITESGENLISESLIFLPANSAPTISRFHPKSPRRLSSIIERPATRS